MLKFGQPRLKKYISYNTMEEIPKFMKQINRLIVCPCGYDVDITNIDQISSFPRNPWIFVASSFNKYKNRGQLAVLQSLPFFYSST